ncbi:MAG TPA: PIN domain-containing protein [Thermoleophilaceae bacterium]|nr:PIN domain-containing protein [Thermoleophilaceae bacterium]
MELADTSAWVVSRRVGAEEASSELDERILRSQVAICDVVRFELLREARNGPEMLAMAGALAALPDCPIGKRVWERALWVYQRLADQGGAHHRSVGYPDLLIAAAAETAGATILHYDEDYERVAEITGQRTRWVLPRGSL